MNENDGKEFAELGVKQWLIKRLFSLGTYFSTNSTISNLGSVTTVAVKTI